MCVSCQIERFVLESGVRLRPVPEMGVCLAYTRARPALHSLNAASWLIVSLCDGRSFADLAKGFHAALRNDQADTDAVLRQGLEQLLHLGVLRREFMNATTP
jgi:hypothetical protein